jgi:hypothetical protein
MLGPGLEIGPPVRLRLKLGPRPKTERRGDRTGRFDSGGGGSLLPLNYGRANLPCVADGSIYDRSLSLGLTGGSFISVFPDRA